MSRPALGGLAITARFTAAARTRESARPDALFVDSWAERLAGPDGFAWLDRLPPTAALWPVVRTRFLDDWLRGLLGVPTPRQVVLVAAGFDTRAFRLDWPRGTRVFEIDRPDLLARKNETLALAGATSQETRITVGADLLASWDADLNACGFSGEDPAIWIVEGLLMYLDVAGARRVMEMISRLSAPSGRLGFDLPLNSLRGHGVTDLERWLRSFGWEASVSTLADVARALGRRPFAARRIGAAASDSTVYLITAAKAGG